MAYRSIKSQSKVVYRVGKAVHICSFRPWNLQAAPGRFDGPTDGPDRFRSLYFASRKCGALIEVLQMFRRDKETLERLNALPDGDYGNDIPDEFLGTVDRSWLLERRLATVELGVNQRFLLVSARSNLNRLRFEMRHILHNLGVPDLDFEVILGRNRTVTQEVAKIARADGFHGVSYLSVVDIHQRCWALFEGGRFELVSMEELTESDREVKKALRLLGLRVVGSSVTQ